MITVLLSTVTLAVGLSIGYTTVVQQVKRGQLIVDGRVYICSDIGPVIRP